ncbi:MAG: peptidylprolyl isomerase [Nitrososphaeria archaeon]|nr:peptidylprolyl isomerase [Nitrosopumilaceae archaeon]NIP09138.1 peptidylprolyl isomerase [Nitrosopumilaceae archaeon]NIP91666.1 peptidylprolyl isomerase [Nitrososphaeria archaeon]NIS95506.1 peptidylprolyl isomerase [Nitrosopumilaceae archaeon]
MLKILLVFAFALVLISSTNLSFGQTEDKLVILETTQGNIAIEFFPEDAPNHVSNFMNLTESGFYDGILFHRIIPGFMIQGGDPNTKNDNTSTWGTGGPSHSVNAEFNDIKHNRGIVSMARSQNPDSAGSQFFIVHQNSNFLDQQYTVFGRIVTDESFETLDKIASVHTVARDIPEHPEEVVIIKATTASRSEISDLLDLGEPERVSSSMDIPEQPLEGTGSQMFENEDLDVAFSVPEGWFLQEPPRVDENTPDVVAVGPKVGEINSVISLRVVDKDGTSFDAFIANKNELLQEVVSTGNLEVISQEKTTINGKEAYVTNAIGIFESNNQSFEVKFKETTIMGNDKFYTFAYSNGIDDFENQLPRFDDSIDSFQILSEPSETSQESSEEGGGCLIATATFGSELAPQVQQLRELRDNTILSTQSGTTFMAGFNEFYYSFSPTIADLERENPAFKEMVKIVITPMLTTLSILNYVDIDSEQEILGYGISIIALNIGMYFAAPAFAIYRIKK